MQKSVLRKYARLISQVGANIGKDQDVIILAEVDQYEFVNILAEECYRLGARTVSIDWRSQKLTTLDVKHRKLKVLSEVTAWQKAKFQHFVDTLPVRIYLDSADPDGAKKMNQEKYGKARQKQFPLLKPYLDQLENKYQWTIAAIPSKAWAKKVFPKETSTKAFKRLFAEILKVSRVGEDPIKEWENHNEDLLKRCQFLNALNLESISYKSNEGTDLTVGLIEDALWIGGGETSLKGRFFNPNIPTEEVFITPKKGVASGKIVSTKPLSYQGQLIENFYFIFKDGKIIEAHAEKNEDLLKQMITMDDGAGYLGECALVPVNSPISESGVLFYNTLFDENASCHLAIGRGFTNCIKDYDKYSLEQLIEKGVNQSMIHVDFMVGSSSMTIIGHTREGKDVMIFQNGRWAF